MKCNKCKRVGKVTINVWKKGDEGLKYKWNKEGAEKDRTFTCECGETYDFMAM